jgi:hypothetical protein
MAKQHQIMHSDLMFIDNLPFLVSVLEPLGLTIASPLASRSEAVLTQEMFNHLNVAKSQQFIVSTIWFDGEKGVAAATYALQEQGYKLDIAGPGQHVPVVERKLRVLKERGRAILHSLPFILPTSLLRYLVSNAVMGINMMPSLLCVDQTSPREAFTGRKCDFKRDLRAAFGDYVQCNVPVTSNDMSPRTKGAIALHPTGNLSGSYKFLHLQSGATFTRDHWEALSTPPEVIAHLNTMAAG